MAPLADLIVDLSVTVIATCSVVHAIDTVCHEEYFRSLRSLTSVDDGPLLGVDPQV